MTEKVDEDEDSDKPASVLEPYVILGSIIFWAVAGAWLHHQEYGVREDWLERLSLVGLISPFIALLIPPLATVFFVFAGLAYCIMGLGYSSDIGPYSHMFTGMFLFCSGVVCVVGSILAAKAHPVLMHACQQIWHDENQRDSSD